MNLLMNTVIQNPILYQKGLPNHGLKSLQPVIFSCKKTKIVSSYQLRLFIMNDVSPNKFGLLP